MHYLCTPKTARGNRAKENTAHGKEGNRAKRIHRTEKTRAKSRLEPSEEDTEHEKEDNSRDAAHDRGGIP